MNKIIFTEEFCQPENLYPFTLTRQIQDIRVGILTIREKWETILQLPSYDKKENDYKDLDRSVDIAEVIGNDVCFIINGNVLPTPRLVKAVYKLRNGEYISLEGNPAIFRITKDEVKELHKIKISKAITIKENAKIIRYPWDIFQLNEWAIREDFDLLTKKRKTKAVSKSSKTQNTSQIFIEKGARVEASILNASAGPIYIGKNSEIMEGSTIRGPFALCENAVLKMGSKIYGAVTLGPGSVGGGEIKNSVIFGNSNKAHDGYLGDSVIGEWCNLGAGTTSSNLKNNAGDVTIWTPKGQMIAGKKCGVMMGDYSKTAINTSINTGTIIGVGCNVFGTSLTPKYIPDFSWGSEGVKRYEFEKMIRDIDSWKKFKMAGITENEKHILRYIYQHY